MEITWNKDKTVTISPVPKKMRKLTGTRFASIFNLNVWNTPFQQWCEITGAYRKPFESTVYTEAGKVVEPKQIDYLRLTYGMTDIIDPTMEYGADPFKETWGNFFPDSHPFGGMWDAIIRDDDGNVTTVIECKSTKRVEDWINEDGEVEPPEYYALQAALYAYLLDCDDVIMPVTFLEEDDYENIEDFKVNADNTTPFMFSLSERYPNFEEDFVNPALEWWSAHVEGGISPEYDERKDADYLKEMRTNSVEIENEGDIDKLLEELSDCYAKITAANKKVEKETKREKAIKAELKKFAEEKIGDNQFAEFSNDRVTCKLTKSSSTAVDEDAMREDGVFDKYAIEKESTRFTVSYAS